MKMQLVTITANEYGEGKDFAIMRELFNDCTMIDAAQCSIALLPDLHTGKTRFCASGFSSISEPTRVHVANNENESIDDFIKAVFSR